MTAFSFQGRANRLEYLLWLALFVALFALFFWAKDTFVDPLIDGSPHYFLISLAVSPPLFLTVWMFVAAGVRRLHDMGTSGWWQVLLLLAGVNAILVIVLLTVGSKRSVSDSRASSESSI